MRGSYGILALGELVVRGPLARGKGRPMKMDGAEWFMDVGMLSATTSNPWSCLIT